MNRKGVILLEIIIALTFLLFFTQELSFLYNTFVKTERNIENKYIALYASRRNLLAAFDGQLMNKDLDTIVIAPNLYKIINKKTGLWIYRYEE
ncbi:MAG: hypothetical protein DKM50_03970 [Candidatus Margulisiibacteriota bacterium]|nr:MAG: hypothetical protein A2X43_01685 [Candidatus Margulisbacteria bacterium GWD2_39_127]OGI05503.1 MAG: hypothetical protein A2X42_00150 [Candidatus Margulisbacteria bacterium GWF2_38_17]OGI08299.1 MAG: hypothetical protein A2X41_00095 [Candidatus Margulisbacteria bacterium GWE2_39_32]PZM82293.1 MAG: hypothetical protein DKM50_03970 [Candidatus Margulisiibacteriota bacterium]HAR62961.1 hypothetical protein [Candidatus Margulisiibacteriota bacterium]